MDRNEVQAQGGIEKIGFEDSFLKFVTPHNEKIILKRYISEHTEGIEFILNTLTSKEHGCLQSLNEIMAVGHRVVHGGEKFNTSVLITQEVIEQIAQCSELAPLHNPANLKGIYTISKLLPKIPQIAVFDTAFHQTIPDYAYMYALPYELYTNYGVRRYGFHGTSHRYVSQRACEFLQTTPAKKRIIVCHIGNGGSITAVKDGTSIDTSMGLTPVEGLMMGTRCGDVDAGALIYIMDKKNLGIAGISDLLNKQSGVLGISGISSDMRELEKGVAEENKRAILADAMYNYRIKKYVGAYAAVLGGVDILVFTGGVGENKSSCRYEVCKDLEFMGVKIDKEVNDRIKGKEAVVSAPDSKVKIVVIPTDEEYMIALDTMNILNN
jgi:acetate kinase